MRSGTIILDGLSRNLCVYTVNGCTISSGGGPYCEWDVATFRDIDKAAAHIEELEKNATDNNIPLDMEMFYGDIVNVDNLIDVQLRALFGGYGVNYSIVELELSD